MTTKTKSVSKVLTEARKLVKKGWIRGEIYEAGSYCAYGAIIKAGTGRNPDFVSEYNMARHSGVSDTVFLLGTLVASQPYGDRHDDFLDYNYFSTRITTFNDSWFNSKADVLLAFDEAVKLAKKMGV